jgi:hypothetical protein
MNTTRLIAHWSMEGARLDLDGRFHSTVDILDAVAASEPTIAAEPSVGSDPLLVKRAGDEDWQPLPS